MPRPNLERVREGLEGGEARSGVEGAGPLKAPSINFLSKPLQFRQLYTFLSLCLPTFPGLVYVKDSYKGRLRRYVRDLGHVCPRWVRDAFSESGLKVLLNFK